LRTETIRKAKIASCGESRLNLHNKLLLIKSIIQPQLTYASTAWGHGLQDPPKKDPSSGKHRLEKCGQCPLVRKEQRPTPGPGMDTGARSHQRQSRQVVSQSDGPRKPPPMSGGGLRARSRRDAPTVKATAAGSRKTTADREATLTSEHALPADKSEYHHPDSAQPTSQDGSDICRPRPRHDYSRGLDEPAKKEEKTEKRQKILPSRRGEARTGGDPSKGLHLPDLPSDGAIIARLSAENNELRKRVAELTCELATVRQQATEEAQKAASRHQGPDSQPGNGTPQIPPEVPQAEQPRLPPVVLRKQENWSPVSRLLKDRKANYVKAKMIGDKHHPRDGGRLPPDHKGTEMLRSGSQSRETGAGDRGNPVPPMPKVRPIPKVRSNVAPTTRPVVPQASQKDFGRNASGPQTQPPRPSAVAVPGKSFAAMTAAGTKKPVLFAVASLAQKKPQVDLAGLVGTLSQFQAIISELQKVAQIIPLLQLDTIEAVAVGIRTSRYGEIAVASCYHPPDRTILEQDIEALLTVGPRVIAIGDFIAKAQEWNSRQLNPSGAALRRFLENTADVVAIGPIEPTFNGQGRFAPDVLDIALLKAIPTETDITSYHEGSFDHQSGAANHGGSHPPKETS
ncbi:hypothetical protein NQ315_003318, partial [Exocentrus adspersus]